MTRWQRLVNWARRRFYSLYTPWGALAWFRVRNLLVLDQIRDLTADEEQELTGLYLRMGYYEAAGATIQERRQLVADRLREHGILIVRRDNND